MPLKGFGEHNLHNWRSQITSLYGGSLEFLFVVESTEDPAYHAVSRLLSSFKDEVEARIVVAGLSTTCSQKIHNQLVGMEQMHKDTEYVLFLDDDVRLHPGSIGALTAEMEKNPEACTCNAAFSYPKYGVKTLIPTFDIGYRYSFKLGTLLI